MDAVNEAMKVLKQVALKEEKGLSKRVDSLTTTLRLLVLSSTRGSLKKKIYGLPHVGHFSQH